MCDAEVLERGRDVPRRPLRERFDLERWLVPSSPTTHVIVYFARGTAIYDVMCGYRAYQNALKNGIGEGLSLWRTPFWS
jgi:hypothetical protein